MISLTRPSQAVFATNFPGWLLWHSLERQWQFVKGLPGKKLDQSLALG